MSDLPATPPDHPVAVCSHRPRVYIIGQSNSVMREGFARKMGQGDLLNVLNIKAIGSSASLLAHHFIQELSHASADYCVLDLAVFDMALVSAKAFKIEDMARYLSSAIVGLRIKGIEPVLLLLPSKWLDQMMHIVYLTQQKVALENRCLQFDGFRWLQEISVEERIDFGSAFSDASHLNPEFSEKLANTLSEFIVSQHSSRFFKSESTIDHQVSPVASIPLADYADDRFIRRATSSALGLSLVRIDRSYSLEIPIGPCERVCGIVIDARASKGKLSISGAGTIVKDLTMGGEGNLSFVARVVPFVGDIADLDGKLYLSIADARTSITEPSQVLPIGSAEADAVYISHVLVERPKRDVSYRFRPETAIGA